MIEAGNEDAERVCILFGKDLSYSLDIKWGVLYEKTKEFHQ